MTWKGVTTSQVTSGGNNFNTSYGDISIVVAENNGVIKPKCQQYTLLNKMLSNFSKVLIAHVSFTTVIKNGDIRKGISCIQKSTKKNYINILWLAAWQKKKTKTVVPK